jgi:two-component system, NarL family, response regulator NreC
MSIRILLADDHHIFREGLRSMFERAPDMEVVAEAQDGRQAVRLAKDLGPDVIILDIAMPELNGIEATRLIIAENPAANIIALSMHSSRKYLSEILKAGAKGYLLKDSPFDELQRAIRAIMAGETYLSPKVTGIVVQGYVNPSKQEEESVFSILSSREREVLQLLAEGYTSKEIADRLYLSAKTVDVHRKNIMDKLGVHNLAELIRMAIREGVTSV